jgi:prepilin-type N-terminal cleavage/methylation domain-containing protein
MSRGYTLVEMVMTVLVLSLVMAFSVPAFVRFSKTYDLQGASENLAAELRLTRERAIATGTNQTMHFDTDGWHVQDGAIQIPGKKLPNGVTWLTIGVTPTFTPNGRASSGGLVVLQNSLGQRDTVSVQASGLILTK